MLSRTVIEVLVTQDKLQCCGGAAPWVSSEQQYADVFAKPFAAQLLADWLPTHMNRVKTDENFQASRKKTLPERQRNTEQHSLKKRNVNRDTKSTRAMTMTMSAVFLAQAAAADGIYYEGISYVLAVLFGYVLVVGAWAACQVPIDSWHPGSTGYAAEWCVP